MVPALDVPVALLEDCHRSGGQFADTLVKCERRWRVAIAQEQVDGGDVDFRPLRKRSQHRAQFGAETHGTTVDPVVNELDARGVARDDKALASIVPEGKPEHPVEPVQDLGSPLLVAMDDDLGVRACAEDVAERFELASQFRKVVDLAVEDDPHRFLRVRHWLMAAGEVDDRESSESQADRSREVIALVVGSAMCNRACHCLDGRRVDGF